MGLARDIGGEIVKALAVLALVFLSFAHQPIPVAQADDGPQWALADQSYCGSGPEGGDGGHAPCHACRTGVADLPPAPCVAEPAYVALGEAGFDLADDLVIFQDAYASANPRAPPATV